MNIKASIKKIIKTNKNSIAFVIGNGINKHCFGDNIKTWNQLISDLSEKYLSETIQPNGISLTELFDLVELKAIEHKSFIAEILDYIHEQKHGINSSFIEKTHDNWEELIKVLNFSHSNSLIPYLREIECFKKTYNSYIKGCKEWCKHNIEDSDTISSKESERIFMDVISNPIKINIIKNIVKKDVIQTYSCTKNSSELDRIMSFLFKLRAPVMTTNFDSLMSQSLKISRHKMGDSFTAFYPWNVYYSYNEIETPTSDFGIWHINGMINYSQSIKLGLSDYMGNVTRARKIMHNKDFNDFFTGKNQKNWSGYYTWLNIFFSRDLFIFGLKLEKDEVFLRWLLIQRARYSQMFNLGLKGWFVDKNISKDTRFFLEHLSFKVISIKNYCTLYDAME